MASVGIAFRRLYNQRLLANPLDTAEQVVRWLGAVQAQDYSGAKWALGQRSKGTTDASIDRAFAEGKILRTHVMRPTWHFIGPADIRWLLELTAPRVHAASAYYYRKFALDQAVFKKSEAIFSKALKGGKQLTRIELAQRLQKGGIAASGPRLGYILMHAELVGLVCSGALRGKQHTYALLEERVAKTKPLSRDEALAELAKRYFTGHGPAQLQDFAWWSGLSATQARAGIELAKRILSQEVVDGKTYWFSGDECKKVKRPTVHLLPNYDECLIAYKDRSQMADVARFERAASPDAFDRHILVLDGKIAGGWRRAIESKRAVMEVSPLFRLSKVEMNALERAAKNYGRFLDIPVMLIVSARAG